MDSLKPFTDSFQSADSGLKNTDLVEKQIAAVRDKPFQTMC